MRLEKITYAFIAQIDVILREVINCGFDLVLFFLIKLLKLDNRITIALRFKSLIRKKITSFKNRSL